MLQFFVFLLIKVFFVHKNIFITWSRGSEAYFKWSEAICNLSGRGGKHGGVIRTNQQRNVTTWARSHTTHLNSIPVQGSRREFKSFNSKLTSYWSDSWNRLDVAAFGFFVAAYVFRSVVFSPSLVDFDRSVLHNLSRFVRPRHHDALWST